MMLEVEKSDIVLVSVTIENTVQVIREVAPPHASRQPDHGCDIH